MDVVIEVLDPEIIFQQLLQRELVLPLQARSVLRYVDGRTPVAVTDVTDVSFQARVTLPPRNQGL